MVNNEYCSVNNEYNADIINPSPVAFCNESPCELR